jgi:hypothetical protein
MRQNHPRASYNDSENNFRLRYFVRSSSRKGLALATHERKKEQQLNASGYSEEAVVWVWRNLKVLGIMPTSHFGHAAVTVMGISVTTTDGDPPHMQHISFWPGTGGAGFHNAFSDLPSSFSDIPKQDRVNEMNKLTAIRLEVGYCRANHIIYPAEWDEALREANEAAVKPQAGLEALARFGHQ